MQNTATMAQNQSTDEAAVQDLIERWVESARKGDLDTIMACYSPDVLAFDAIGALQFKGEQDYRKHWETCLSYMQPGTEMIFEIHELGISVGGDIAFAHYLSRCGGADLEGKEHLCWMRGTVCCRKTPEGWRIAHEHYSMPFDPETNQVADDLKP